MIWSKLSDISGTVTVTSMANLGKLMSNGPNGAPATVLLQSQTGNILLPPGAGVKQAAQAGAGQLVRQGPVMVRQTAQAGQQSSPVLVQLPSGEIKRREDCNLMIITLTLRSTAGQASEPQPWQHQL